ncbi:MAG: DNA polymerase III subunit chi [Caulobacterales bacterium]
MAAEVWFYHLETKPLAHVLADLLEKCHARGWNAIVRGPNPKKLDELDAGLWSFDEASFLPHGRDGIDAARQPILLTPNTSNPNGAKALFLVDGAAPETLDGYERVCVLIDGGDEAAVKIARGHWKDVKASGAAVSYWRQSETGRWEKKA